MSLDLKFHAWSAKTADSAWDALPEMVQTMRGMLNKPYDSIRHELEKYACGDMVFDSLKNPFTETQLMWLFTLLDLRFGSLAHEYLGDTIGEYVSRDLLDATGFWEFSALQLSEYFANLDENLINETAIKINTEKYTDPSVDPNNLWVYPHQNEYLADTKKFFELVRALLQKAQMTEDGIFVIEAQDEIASEDADVKNLFDKRAHEHFAKYSKLFSPTQSSSSDGQ